MPTTPNQQPPSPALSTDEPVETGQTESMESLDLSDNASEVAKRLSLLGKLIIPPAPR